jgi:hypothetical protein
MNFAQVKSSQIECFLCLSLSFCIIQCNDQAKKASTREKKKKTKSMVVSGGDSLGGGGGWGS